MKFTTLALPVIACLLVIFTIATPVAAVDELNYKGHTVNTTELNPYDNATSSWSHEFTFTSLGADSQDQIIIDFLDDVEPTFQVTLSVYFAPPALPLQFTLVDTIPLVDHKGPSFDWFSFTIGNCPKYTQSFGDHKNITLPANKEGTWKLELQTMKTLPEGETKPTHFEIAVIMADTVAPLQNTTYATTILGRYSYFTIPFASTATTPQTLNITLSTDQAATVEDDIKTIWLQKGSCPTTEVYADDFEPKDSKTYSFKVDEAEIGATYYLLVEHNLPKTFDTTANTYHLSWDSVEYVESSSSSGMQWWQIALIVVGALAALAVVVAVAIAGFFIWRRGRSDYEVFDSA